MLVSVLLAFSLLCPAVSLGDDVYSKFFELYSRTAELSLKGVETGRLEELLASALHFIEAGDYGRASEVMSEVGRCLLELESRVDELLLVKNLVKYGTAVALLVLPLLIYLLLPRLYVYLWYMARRSWVVTSERPR
ncbi:MAG: hypothetical protein QXI94_04170 [Sulfolobales archaeon]